VVLNKARVIETHSTGVNKSVVVAVLVTGPRFKVNCNFSGQAALEKKIPLSTAA
jgi:hypothetical protein